MTKETNRRFKSIERGSGGCVYVAEISNGIVKIGFSRNPRVRLQSLEYEVRKKLGASLSRFYVSKSVPVFSATHAENKTLKAAREVGDQVPRTLEYFTGIRFESAVDIVEANIDQPEYAQCVGLTTYIRHHGHPLCAALVEHLTHDANRQPEKAA